MNIKTNNHWREFISVYDLTDNEKEEFDYYDADVLETMLFIRYKREVYALDCFMCIEDRDVFMDWTGHLGSLYYAGILIKISQDNDAYKIATYYN